MSRIGRMPIELPPGVEVSNSEGNLSVKGPKGVLEFALPKGIEVRSAQGELVVSRASEAREHRALHGLCRTLVSNMVQGVTQGFEKVLEIQGVGYRAALRGGALEIAVGYSHTVVVEAPAGIAFEVPSPTRIIVRGTSKQSVGQTAANLRALRPPDPYKAKGIRYQGEQVRRKAGKAGK